MRNPEDVIAELDNTIDAEIQEIKNRIISLRQQITDLDNQINAFKVCILFPCSTKLTNILIEKAKKLQGVKLIKVNFGSAYNKIEFGAWLDDWKIIDDEENILYQYNGPGWDKDPEIKKLMTRWEIANDYLTRPMSTGASYGLIPYKHTLEDSIHMLSENLDKLEEMKGLYKDFLKEL